MDKALEPPVCMLKCYVGASLGNQSIVQVTQLHKNSTAGVKHAELTI